MLSSKKTCVATSIFTMASEIAFFSFRLLSSAYFLTILQIPHSSCQPGLQEFPNKQLLKVVINSTFITL